MLEEDDEDDIQIVDLDAESIEDGELTEVPEPRGESEMTLIIRS